MTTQTAATYTIDCSEADAVDAAVTACAAVPVAELLAGGRAETAPQLPAQIRRLSAGPRGAEWVRVVADYQDAPSVGYASLDDLGAAHGLPASLDLDWTEPEA